MPDSHEDSRIVQQLFEDALRRDPHARAEFLDLKCAGRSDIRARVEALLGAHASDVEFAGLTRRDRADIPAPGAAAVDVEGRRIGPYVLRRELGRGGMGVVYLADDTRLSRAVAIKALSPTLNQTPGLRERLRNEARLAGGLSHPGIATVYALEEVEGELYLACEYVPGPALRALVRSGALPGREVLDIGLQLARALAEAHAKGIVHRDIKPENVIRTPSGLVKILDFGLARVEGDSHVKLTQTGVVMGTPAYLSPEQALGRPTDFRTDVFAFGLLLYELASGSNPFIGQTITATLVRIVELDPAPLSEVQPDVAPALDRIVRRCLQKDPADRYGSTHEIVADLERLREETASGRQSGGKLQFAPLVRRSRAQQWLVVHQVAMSVLYIAMLVTAWFTRIWLPQPWSRVFLLTTLAMVAAATSLRLHLWFTAATFPRQLAGQHAQAWRWTRVFDAGLALALMAAAVGLGGSHEAFAMLFLGVAVAVLVTSFAIEPATARSAFERLEDEA
jgi:hypothetical protein